MYNNFEKVYRFDWIRALVFKSKLLPIFPFRIKRDSHVSAWCETSYFKLILSISFHLTVLIGFYTTCLVWLSGTFRVTKLSGFYVGTAIVVSYGVAIYTSMRYSDEVYNFIYRAYISEISMSNFSYGRNSCKVLLMIFVESILLASSVIYAIILTGMKLHNTINQCCWYVIFMSCFIVNCQFLTFVDTQKRRFEKLNSHISIVVDARQLHNKNLQSKNNSTSKSERRKEQFLPKIDILMASHNLFCNDIEEVNKRYSLLLLLGVKEIFEAITFLGFLMIQLVYFKRFNSSTYCIESLHHLFWAAAETLKFTAVLSSCRSSANEANRTAQVVHQLLSYTDDPILREELQLFSMQLLHRKVEFTAGGLFPLDYRLLCSIFGAVTTYMIILVQLEFTG